jgi:hypothetical protein
VEFMASLAAAAHDAEAAETVPAVLALEVADLQGDCRVSCTAEIAAAAPRDPPGFNTSNAPTELRVSANGSLVTGRVRTLLRVARRVDTPGALRRPAPVPTLRSSVRVRHEQAKST